MISALYQSRPSGGVSCFNRSGFSFGWQAIEGLLQREVARIQSNMLPRVPGLKESFVHRDPWTRLNVKPAKIMQVLLGTTLTVLLLHIHRMFPPSQQEHVLAELQEYATTDPPPADADSVLETVEYLRACNQIFERGILGKKVFIRSSVSPIIKNMETGYQYFTQWLNRKLETGQPPTVIMQLYMYFYMLMCLYRNDVTCLPCCRLFCYHDI